jgi:nucleoside-diphosphate-sugar epimerase
MNDDNHVIVTGGTGFVGANLTGYLQRQGYSMHVIVRSSSDLRYLNQVCASAKLHPHDGTTADMIRILREVQPKTVFHLASLFVAEHNPVDVEPLVISNILFGTQLLEAMREAGVSNLVNTGTSWQHYLKAEYHPVCLYAATKEAFENILAFYEDAYHLQSVTLKLFDTFGPNDPRKKIFQLLQDISESNSTLAMSPGDQMLDLVYIDDVCEAYRLADLRLRAGLVTESERFAVCSGKRISLRALVEIYEHALGRHLPIQWGAKPYRSREVMMPWEGYRTLPGWKPRLSVAEGIQRILETKVRG